MGTPSGLREASGNIQEAFFSLFLREFCQNGTPAPSYSNLSLQNLLFLTNNEVASKFALEVSSDIFFYENPYIKRILNLEKHKFQHVGAYSLWSGYIKISFANFFITF